MKIIRLVLVLWPLTVTADQADGVLWVTNQTVFTYILKAYDSLTTIQTGVGDACGPGVTELSASPYNGDNFGDANVTLQVWDSGFNTVYTSSGPWGNSNGFCVLGPADLTDESAVQITSSGPVEVPEPSNAVFGAFVAGMGVGLMFYGFGWQKRIVRNLGGSEVP